MMKGRGFESGGSDDDFGDEHDIRYTSLTGSCQQMPRRRMDRKKRRGVIEKRRRDRINGSLSELKRLVPSAYEKQGSTKLEKAEILQLTVDHLRMLNAKGLNVYGADSSSLALDYRSIGFRECVAETARYLATVEGMDLQDPLRMRLLGHLEAYSAQRDATAKVNMQSLSSLSASWCSLNNGSPASLAHPAKYSSYGISSKSSLGQLGGLLGSGQNNQMEGAYLAASRLGSAIGLNATSSVTSSNLSQMAPPVSQQTGSCHFPVSSSFSPRYNHPGTNMSQLPGLGSTAAHHQMKHARNFAADLAY